jgi:hypothetical protein
MTNDTAQITPNPNNRARPSGTPMRVPVINAPRFFGKAEQVIGGYIESYSELAKAVRTRLPASAFKMRYCRLIEPATTREITCGKIASSAR